MNAQTAPSHPTAAVGAAPQPTSGTRLADTVVLVTGASRGIGEAISRACALQGATVVHWATRQDLREQVRADLIAQGVPAERLSVMPVDFNARTAGFASV